jgi:hypothetical protein
MELARVDGRRQVIAPPNVDDEASEKNAQFETDWHLDDLTLKQGRP